MTTNTAGATALIPAHGGKLINLQLSKADAATLIRDSSAWPSWTLSTRQICDLELLINGAFSPLTGFLNQKDYARVVNELRLADGTLWPIPITLDVSENFADTIKVGSRIVLRNNEGVPHAVLEVEDIYRPDRVHEVTQVFGSSDLAHPGVSDVLQGNPVYLGGRVHGLQPIEHADFAKQRFTPQQLRDWFAANGWDRVVAFQTRNPLHRAHQQLTLRAAEQAQAKLLIHPVVGRTKPGDVDHYTRVRCYQALLPHYPEGSVKLSLLGLAMRMGGPREAVWHAIIRKNHGVTHFIVGRDHAGPGNDSSGKPFYEPFAAQDLLKQYADEIGITAVFFPEMVYVANRDTYVPSPEVQAGDEVRSISGTEQRRRLVSGEELPAWFTFPDVEAILRERFPAKNKRGFVLFFTGLSGSGKSTLAQAVEARLLESSSRSITILDGDLVRRHLSKGLGFSKEDRETNILRIGYVASEIVKHGGIAICAPIAPYAASRDQTRKWVEANGGEFIEIHVATPLETCEARDRKGLYAQARAGKIQQFTGISDPYEVPEKPELRLDTTDQSVFALTDVILDALRERGLIG